MTTKQQTDQQTEDALTADCRFLRDLAKAKGTTQQAIYEDDDCRVRITAQPNGHVSLEFNPGMLMSAFARIMAEDEAAS